MSNKTNYLETDCSNKLMIKKTDGEAILESEALVSVTDFIDQRLGNDPVMGYHMGLDTFEKMYTEIKEYNDEPANIKKIIGVRFYHALSDRTFSDLSIVNEKDLVAVPTLDDGKDIYYVYPEVGFLPAVNIYSKFRPCPKLCGRESYLPLKPKD